MNKLTQEQIEEAAIKSAENFGAAEIMIFQDPETGEPITFDMKNLTEEQIELLYKVLSR